MQASAAVATGTIDFVIGHAIAWMPMLIANVPLPFSGVDSGYFNPARIFDDACLAFLELNEPATTATNYAGQFWTVSS